MHIYIYIISIQIKTNQVISYQIKSKSDQRKAKHTIPFHIISYHIKAYHSISYHIIYKLDIDITADVHFCFTSPYSPLSPDPSCQLLDSKCWCSVCPFLHTDFGEERCFREERFVPPKMQPYPLFSKILCLIFFSEKLCCDFHREIYGENGCSRKNGCSRENDCLS